MIDTGYCILDWFLMTLFLIIPVMLIVLFATVGMHPLVFFVTLLPPYMLYKFTKDALDEATNFNSWSSYRN